jgi:hypothetical protein
LITVSRAPLAVARRFPCADGAAAADRPGVGAGRKTSSSAHRPTLSGRSPDNEMRETATLYFRTVTVPPGMRAPRMRPIVADLLFAGAVALVCAAAFLQFERGVGSPARSLLFVGFDFLLVGALAAWLVALTARPRASLLLAASTVLLVWYGGYVKWKHTGIFAVAPDLLDLVGAWSVVGRFATVPLAVTAACLAAVLAIGALERPWPMRAATRGAWAGAGALALAGCVGIATRLPFEDPSALTVPAGPKIAQFFRSLYAPPRFADARVPALDPWCCFSDREPYALAFEGDVKPNVVVVLQESTFVPTILRGESPVSNVLFDGSAPLRVHVQGGGTWVEEYSVLHGVPPPLYGPDYVQVLRLGTRHGLKGRLAEALLEQGYDTHSVIPLPGDLLNAREMHASLGIRNVRDCAQAGICDPARAWHETLHDSALYGAALAVLRAARDRPAFVYVATMRQHSPHVDGFPKSAYRPEVMAEYRRRLALSDADARAFLAELASLPRPTVVLMFGDHIPSDVVAAFSPEDFVGDRFTTFFNLYRGDARGVAAERVGAQGITDPVDSAYLDALLLQEAGFRGGYVSRKLGMMTACPDFSCDGRRLAQSSGVREP